MGDSILPFQFRANDVQHHIINVDTRFRDSFDLTSAANFYMTLLSPIKNIMRIRITSFEFPNNYYMFTKKRHLVSFQVIYMDETGVAMGVPVQIPDGSYTACELEKEINSILNESDDINWLSVKFNPINGHFIFTGGRKFGINTGYESKERSSDYGLGYYMGFTRGLHKSVSCPLGRTWTVESCCQANFAGDSYILMRLNDYRCVKQIAEGNDLSVFAKFILNEQKNYVTFDDYASQHIKEIVFPNPQDLSRLHVQILDAYGDLIDLGCNNFSFSIEVTEIKNMSLYNSLRDSLGTEYRASKTITL